tara:strand:- start:7043 stop:7708 length:666 start_codon:yes stop_codon:yes gene_type:complete
MNKPATDRIAKQLIQNSKYNVDPTVFSTLPIATIWENLIADNNVHLDHSPGGHSAKVDFTDGTDAKYGTLSWGAVNKSGTAPLRMTFSSCNHKFGHLRVLEIDPKTDYIFTGIVDKYYLNSDQESCSFSLNKFGKFFEFTLEEVVELSNEEIDAEFASRIERLGERPEIQIHTTKKDSTPNKDNDSVGTLDELAKTLIFALDDGKFSSNVVSELIIKIVNS